MLLIFPVPCVPQALILYKAPHRTFMSSSFDFHTLHFSDYRCFILLAVPLCLGPASGIARWECYQIHHKRLLCCSSHRGYRYSPSIHLVENWMSPGTLNGWTCYWELHNSLARKEQAPTLNQSGWARTTEFCFFCFSKPYKSWRWFATLKTRYTHPTLPTTQSPPQSLRAMSATEAQLVQTEVFRPQWVEWLPP